jgi:hypothetical protein
MIRVIALKVRKQMVAKLAQVRHRLCLKFAMVEGPI